MNVFPVNLPHIEIEPKCGFYASIPWKYLAISLFHKATSASPSATRKQGWDEVMAMRRERLTIDDVPEGGVARQVGH